MKKYIAYLSCLLVISFSVRAQRPATLNATTSAQLKSLAQARMAYNPTTGGNEFTTSLVTRVTPSLNLTTDQQKFMNTALYNYFNEKGTYTKLKWSDKVAYQAEVNSLVQKLLGQLGAFLSAGQVNSFASMKPANAQTRDPLATVFY